jgi:ribosomal protein L37AE/L43A
MTKAIFNTVCTVCGKNDDDHLADEIRFLCKGCATTEIVREGVDLVSSDDPQLLIKMLRPSYEVQDGCWNCKHHFVKKEYDDADTLFCILGAPLRPFCGSVLLEERHECKTSKETDAKRLAWEIWKAQREVVESGKCSHYERE